MKKEKSTTKQCKRCKAEIPADAKRCPVCNKKQKMGIVPKTLITIFVLSAIASTFDTDDSNNAESSPTSSETVTKEATTPREAFITVLTINPNVTTEAAEKAYDLLTEELGFTEITAKESGSDLTLFKVKADDYILSITVNDDVYMIICGNYNLYKDGIVQYTKKDLDDRSLNGKETQYYSIAKEIILANLKAPKTAEFPSIVFNSNDIKMARNEDVIAVQSYVDAQNSFGALTRSNYLVEFKIIDLDSYSYETIYLNIDGSESGEYIDLK